MFKLKWISVVIFVLALCKIDAEISDKRLCYDAKCTVPLSKARSLLRYSSPEPGVLSFIPNDEVTVYSKSAGSRADLWGVEINGKRGYVPKHLIRENKILNAPALLVDTEEFAVPSNKNVEPNKVQEPFEVVDGTTIYLATADGGDAINPSSTESSVQPTALPLIGETNSDETTTVLPPEEPEEKAQISEFDASMTQADFNTASDSEPHPTYDNTSENAIDDLLEKTVDTIENTVDILGEEIINTTNNHLNNDVDGSMKETINTIDDNASTVEFLSEEPLKSNDPNDLNKVDSLIAETSNLNTLEEVPVEETIEPIIAADLNKANGEILDVIPINTAQSLQETENLQQVYSEAPLVENITETLPVDIELLPFGVTTEPTDIKQDHLLESNVVSSIKPELDHSTSQYQYPPEPEEAIIDPASQDQNQTHGIEEGIVEENTDAAEDTFNAFAQNSSILLENQDDPVEFVISAETANSNKMELDVSTETTVDVEMRPPPIEYGNITPDPVEMFSDATLPEDLPIDKAEENEVVQENPDLSAPSVEKVEENSLVEDIHVDPEIEPIKDVSTAATDGDLESPSYFSALFSLFGGSKDTNEEVLYVKTEEVFIDPETIVSALQMEQRCAAPPFASPIIMSSTSDIFLYLVTTAVSVIIFLFGYIAFDKSKREGPLVAKINILEKELLIIVKENQILSEKLTTESGYDRSEPIPSQALEHLEQELQAANTTKAQLEEQIQSLEKELENSTEVGMELNRMLTDILSSERGSEVIKANVEHLQRQLVEQQATINTINHSLAESNTENHELKLELDLSNKKTLDLQSEVDRLVLDMFKIEEEKDIEHSTLESERTAWKTKEAELVARLKLVRNETSEQISTLEKQMAQASRTLALKTKEHDALLHSVKQLKAIRDDGSKFKALVESGAVRAELSILQVENGDLKAKLAKESDARSAYEKRMAEAEEEVKQLKVKHDKAEHAKVETETKLEVLSNYFKDREGQMQKEISKLESVWAVKEGEVSNTTKRIQFMQDQLQNYKAQTDSLKQEIMSQEVELKSQISVLEKKVHENWVSARQAERKLEDAKQEAAQLRARLTLSERNFQGEKTRIQSPIENGEIPISPLESPASPPLLYGSRDHMTKSPPMPGLPPFLPPGVPFMPPPPLHGVPPFIPPPPNMFPGDHRPPPLGRMSSPPLRYSPSSRGGYSPYDHDSSSQSESEYGVSPPQRSRGYSPFNDRREYSKRPQGRSNGRNMKGIGSSESGRSNDSLDKMNGGSRHQQSKV